MRKRRSAAREVVKRVQRVLSVRIGQGKQAIEQNNHNQIFFLLSEFFLIVGVFLHLCSCVVFLLKQFHSGIIKVFKLLNHQLAFISTGSWKTTWCLSALKLLLQPLTTEQFKHLNNTFTKHLLQFMILFFVILHIVPLFLCAVILLK